MTNKMLTLNSIVLLHETIPQFIALTISAVEEDPDKTAELSERFCPPAAVMKAWDKDELRKYLIGQCHQALAVLEGK